MAFFQDKKLPLAEGLLETEEEKAVSVWLFDDQFLFTSRNLPNG